MSERDAASVQDVVYASWGGQGHSEALRVAVERARDADARLTYLAVLDEDSFGELDHGVLGNVDSELTWLLEAQLKLVARQAGASDIETRAIVVTGDVRNEINHFIEATRVERILFGAIATDRQSVEDVDRFAREVAADTGIDVEVIPLNGVI